MVDVAVIGGAGYAGIEAIRFVLGHPLMRLSIATSSTERGQRVDDVYPSLAGLTDVTFTEPDVDSIADRAALAFLGVPHTVALDIVPELLAQGVRVFDASADYRLKQAEVYEQWYGVRHTSPDLLGEAVYGLPEINRERLEGARLVACPGCYPTASILAALPALEGGIVDSSRVVIDAKSGVSGAGRSASSGTHFSTVNESLAPYKVGQHRHTPEIEQGLSFIAEKPVRVVFAPHLVPMTRGLLATVYMDLVEPITNDDVYAVYASRYSSEPFVTVHKPGRMPSTREVSGTNRAHIGITVDERTNTLIAVCAIDNLVKGTAGQAIQCANIALGFEETTGLMVPGPVI